MLNIRVHPEPASRILNLCAVPEQQLSSTLRLVIGHVASRSVFASEGIGLREAEEALRRYYYGLPVDNARLHLDEIRSDAARLETYVNSLLEDQVWLRNASDLALKYIRGEMSFAEPWIFI